MIPLFRPTTADFRKWCKVYVGLAFDIVDLHKQYPNLVNDEDFKAAQKICRQYRVLLASLGKEERRILENTIMKNKAIHFSVKEERIAFDIIFGNWKEICFPGRKFQLKTVTKEQIGKRLKALREQCQFTRAYVADVIGISEATLKAYENGDRMLRFDVAYLLTQVYGVEMNTIV